MLVEAQRQNPLDAIVLLCGGTTEPFPQKHILNNESGIKVFAAVEAYQQGQENGHAPDIIPTGGALWEAPPMGHMMADALHNFGIPRENIKEENKASDTSYQARDCTKIIRQEGYEKVGIVGDSEHVKRAVTLFNRYDKTWYGKRHGVEFVPLVAEDLAREREERIVNIDTIPYKSPIDTFHEDPNWQRWEKRESLLRKLMKVDRKLLSTRFAAKAMRTWPILRNIRAKGTT